MLPPNLSQYRQGSQYPLRLPTQYRQGFQDNQDRPTKRIVNKDENDVVTGVTEIWDVRSLNLVRSFRLEELAELTQDENQAATPAADAAALRGVAARIEREHIAKKTDGNHLDKKQGES